MHVLVLGAGQLARMMALAGAPLNIQISAFDVNTQNIIHPLTQAIIEHDLANAIEQADVITSEFEHIPHDVLAICAQHGKLLPDEQAIKTGGDRRFEKSLLDAVNVKNANYAIIHSRADLDLAITTIGLPMVLKSALGGYDGKGQWRLKNRQEADMLWLEMQACIDATPNQAIVGEKFIPFEREVSLVGVRARDGSVAVYPLTENIHINGVLNQSTPINEHPLQQQAKAIFTTLANRLEYVGVLALEFFEYDNQLLVNEIAPRVHNSGHWTQQGAETCQFENHLRAVCNMPLGSTALLRPTAMINVLGIDTLPQSIFALEGCHVHWYGKEKQAGRKMGHINICAKTPIALQDKLHQLSLILNHGDFPMLHQ